MSNEELRKIEYCYGGDYNNYDLATTTSTAMVSSVLTVSSILMPTGVAYQYQNIWAKMVNAEKAK